MKFKSNIFFAFSFILILSCASNNENKYLEKRNLEYLKLTSEFLESINRNRDVILIDEPYQFEDFDCFDEAVKNDTVVFSKNEIEFIRNEFKLKKLKKWNNEIINTAKIISSRSVEKIFNNSNNGWNTFKSKIGSSFNIYSAPIFLRDNNYCLFYSSIHCGSLCGEGMLDLYKNEDGNWKLIKSYCSWIS